MSNNIRNCLFAGGSGAIGHDSVLRLTASGVNVGLITHSMDNALSLQKECEGNQGQCVILTDKNKEELFEKFYQQFGSIDIFISKTGVLQKPVRFEEITADMLEKSYHNQIVSLVNNLQKLLPYLKKSPSGRIILFSTIGSLTGFPAENMVDSISKGALNSLIYHLSRQLASDGVTVNGITLTGLVSDHQGIGLDPVSYLDRIPVNRLGTSEDLAGLIEYLSSEKSSFLTGQIIRFSGGMAAGI